RAQVSSLSFGDEPLLHLATDLPASRHIRRVAEGFAGGDARGGRRLGRISARVGHRGRQERAPSDYRSGLRDRRAYGGGAFRVFEGRAAAVGRRTEHVWKRNVRNGAELTRRVVRGLDPRIHQEILRWIDGSS